MLKEQRRQSIMRALQESGTVRVSHLAEALESSRATIWRDIDELARRGVVTKVHGGATLAHPHTGAEGIEEGLELAPPRPGLVVGIQVPESLYFFGPIIAGAKRACELAGAELVVSISGYLDEDVREAVDTLIDAEADGMLLTPNFTPLTSADSSRWMRNLDRPVVLVERECPGLDLPGARSVSTAREAGSYAALQHLESLGHERVGLLSLNDTVEPMRRVIDGWKLACRDLGLNTDCAEPPVWIGEDLPKMVEEIRAAGITGLLCMNDALAARLLREFRRVGLKVPEDLSLIAYDDEIAEHLSPSLTAVSPERELVGFIAAQQLLALLSNGDPGPGRRITIDPSLELRESTAPPRSSGATA